jgi:methylthioribulose-1-phosphate dehydratase
MTQDLSEEEREALVHSEDPEHPANHICNLCAKFYNLGWVMRLRS